MSRSLTLLAVILACSACQQEDREGTVPAQGPVEAATVVVTGKDAYLQACASCHEEGKDGAPKTGDPDAWAGRSSLWEAVLFEHAQEGYLDMPAHGTDGTLSDETVTRAAQYMLEITHPDRLPD